MNTSTLETDLWFANIKSSEHCTLRLFCFPYAGGSTWIFRKWHRFLPGFVAVCPAQLPGRGNRLKAPPLTSFSELVKVISHALGPYLDKPFAFFGHSMGALISFELAHRMQRDYGAEPFHLFVSGSLAPQTLDMGVISQDPPNSAFIEYFRKRNSVPKEALENPELIELMIPILRADFQICQTYSYLAKPPLSCPITVFGGLQERAMTREKLAGWRDHTTNSFSVRMFPGDHFFLHRSESLLVSIIRGSCFDPKLAI